MKPKLSISGLWGKIDVVFLVKSDKWYIRQMKVLNSMNCRASDMSDKLHGLLFSIGILVYLLSIKASPSASKKDPLPRIKQTECDMDSKIKLKVFKELVNEFKTKNMA